MATAFREPTFCGAKTLYTNVLIAHFSALLKCPKHDFTSFWWLKAITPNINCYKETLKLFTSTTDNWHVLWALKMSSGSLALPLCPMLSYRLANIGSLGSISFTFPLILPSTTQLPSNPLNLIPCLQAAILEVCLNETGLEQGPGNASIAEVKVIASWDNEASISGFSKGFCPYFYFSSFI